MHEIGGRLAETGGFHEVLDRVVEFASALVRCDSCLIYVIEGEHLVLRASKKKLRIPMWLIGSTSA